MGKNTKYSLFKKKSKIEGMQPLFWVLYITLYAGICGFLYGMTEFYLDYSYSFELFGNTWVFVPIYAVYVFGGALGTVLVLIMKAKFAKKWRIY